MNPIDHHVRFIETEIRNHIQDTCCSSNGLRGFEDMQSFHCFCFLLTCYMPTMHDLIDQILEVVLLQDQFPWNMLFLRFHRNHNLFHIVCHTFPLYNGVSGTFILYYFTYLVRSSIVIFLYFTVTSCLVFNAAFMVEPEIIMKDRPRL